jgi:hypothetical protein
MTRPTCRLAPRICRLLSLSFVAVCLHALAAGCAGPSASAPAPADSARPSPSPAPGDTPAHPFLLFGPEERQALAAKRDADELLAEQWTRLRHMAANGNLYGRDKRDDDERRKRPAAWARRLEAMALIWQLERDGAMADQAIALMSKGLEETDPVKFYDRTNFHGHAKPLRALALGWDWLYDRMSPTQRKAMLPKLDAWCAAAFHHAEKNWWRDSSYNVGAIPRAGMGLLALSILGESESPMTAKVYREAVRRIAQNFFPTSWKPSGICYEGPNYAIVGYRYVAPFCEALRRAGGPDLIGRSGVRHAMTYQMYQWMPMQDCAPIGDNTGYGRRTFAAEYLLGMDRTRDREGLYRWRTTTKRRYLDPLITYLWYPLDLEPRGPAEAGLPTSKYFEVTADRAGYVFSRSRWEDRRAAFFAFVTRFEKCNHQHYDMNSFLFGGRGTLFATHRLLFPYGHPNHGVDYEHNLVVVDGGGWPKQEGPGCGHVNSTDGVLVGLALGDTADYVRGDAKWSYRDNSVQGDDPAIRAERACLFAKQGDTPYLLILDDIQYRDRRQRYDWLWYAPHLPIAGSGTLEDPVTITAENGRCAIRFLAPARPKVAVKPALGRRRTHLKRLEVPVHGNRVQFVAVASIEPVEGPGVEVLPLEAEAAVPVAGAARLRLPDGAEDTVAWQSEEDRVQCGRTMTAGDMETDGLLAWVRVREGKLVGYVLGEGTYLKWKGRTLVRAAGRDSVSVSAGPEGIRTRGRLRTRKGLPEIPPEGCRAVRP